MVRAGIRQGGWGCLSLKQEIEESEQAQGDSLMCVELEKTVSSPWGLGGFEVWQVMFIEHLLYPGYFIGRLSCKP